MTIDTLHKKLSAISELVGRHSNRMAMDRLRELTSTVPELASFAPSLEALEQKYYFMLRFLDSTTPFEGLGAELQATEKSLRGIMDSMLLAFRTANDPGQYFAQLRFQKARPEETLESLFADYIEESKRLSADPAVLTDTRTRATLERIASDIFMHIWTEPALTPDRADTLRSLIFDPDIPEYDREMWLNAVGITDVADPGRINILLDAYHSGETRISVASLMWLVLAIARPEFYSLDREYCGSVLAKLREKAPDILAMAAGLCRTAVGSDPANEEMIRDLGRMSAGMAEKLGNADPQSPEELESALNDIPDGYYDKMRAFAEAQQRGDDVYASTIGRMRHFPFFRRLPEWFAPFHIDRSELAAVVDSEGVGMATLLEKMHALCDGDKYALVLSLSQAPESMRSAMLGNAYESISNLSATEEGAEMMRALEGNIPRREAIANVVKGLSRFLKHSSMARETDMPRSATPIVDAVLRLFEGDLPEGFEEFADGLAASGSLDNAVACYSALVVEYQNADATPGADLALVLAKAGTACLKAKMTERAQLYFERALDAGDTSPETAMHLAEILIKDPYSLYIDGMEISSRHTPVSVLEPHAEQNSGNPDFLRLLGEAHSHMGNHAKAAETFFNLNFILPPDDYTAKRPLAEELISCGEFEEAVQVLSDVPDLEKEVEISVLLASALWCTGARDAAIRTLMNALPAADGDTRRLRNLLAHAELRLPESADKDHSLNLLADIVDYKAFGSRFGNLS